VESTWENRDLPVLDAIVRYYDESENPYARILDVEMLAKITGMDPGQVGRAVRALRPRFIRIEETMGGIMDAAIMGITDEAREKVGQWPTAEAVADRIVTELVKAAEQEPDERKRTKLRAAAETLGSFGRDLLISVAANVATKPLSF
jgi:hypothetical protein